ncbi:MAG: hypothetical protein MUP16_08200 [Sedimentisphaerales bacterium]|nr:hypothetical protein [Sedimentisphaerales bacterium]
MKALVISMLILLIAFFSLIPAFGQLEEKAPNAQTEKQMEEPAKEAEPKKTADVNTAADANAVADPNAVRAKIKEFEGLGEALEKINANSGNEISEWTQGRLDDRLDLVLAMKKQITAEFKFLRELAIKEGAVKTTAAIDGILLDRQERFKDVIEKLEKESERVRRLSEREEKKTKEREQRERSREERGREERTRERPTDRTRRDTQ